MLAKQSIRPSSLLNHAHWYWVLAWFICCFYGDWPCTVIWKHTSIIHIQPHILVLGLGLGHMLFLWWLTMYRHMGAHIHHPYSISHNGIGSWLRSCVIFWCMTMYLHLTAYIHHPYSFTHIGIGSWLGSYVVIMVTYHVPSYESIHPSSTINHAYWYWVLVWVICCFNGDRSCTVIWEHHPYSITHIGIWSWLGSCVVFRWFTMYRHMKAHIHHPYSMTHIDIGFWLGSYVVFIVTVHVPSYESIHPSSILNHT